MCAHTIYATHTQLRIKEIFKKLKVITIIAKNGWKLLMLLYPKHKAKHLLRLDIIKSP